MKINSFKNYSSLKINIFGKFKKFIIHKNLEVYVENVLASLAVVSNFLDLNNLNRKFFINYNLLEGRGDYNYIKLKKKKWFFSSIFEILYGIRELPILTNISKKIIN